MSRIAVLIVAAGKGARAATDLPKQYESLAGLPMLRRTVQAFAGYFVQVVIGDSLTLTYGSPLIVKTVAAVACLRSGVT